MPENIQNSQQLWTHVLHSIQQKVSINTFDTWFRPIVFSGCSNDTFDLAVPTENFRRVLMESFASVINDSIAEVTSMLCRLNISVRAPEILENASSAWPVVQASQIECDSKDKPWLIERLWSAHAVGFVSGPPKSFKTWTVLEMAVSVASGLPCLGAFPVHGAGPVLLYAAEDPPAALRLRLLALAQNHGLKLDQIDIRIIRADSLRLDRAADREKLAATVELHRPVLLVLDPLVRLHALDENQAAAMAELLGHIRSLQRSFNTAVAIVHHCRKSPARSPGQSLRGSSDLYAFVDSLVSLQRRHGCVMFSAEHRSAPELAPIPLELVASMKPNAAPYLRIVTAPSEESPPKNQLEDNIVQFLKDSSMPCSTDFLRTALHVRKQRLLEAMRNLLQQGLIQRNENNYILITDQNQRKAH